MKVLYTGYDIREPYRIGETTGQTASREGSHEYILVDGQLQPKSFVFPDTPANRQRLEAYQAEYKAWKDLEPNVYIMLNAMQKL